jgi:PAS domain S-box-containing protein
MSSNKIKNQNTVLPANHMENIFKSIPDILFVLTPQAKIHMINQAACFLLRYKEEELIGQNISLILEKQLLPLIKNLTAHEYLKNIETNIISKDGNKIYVLLSCSLLLDDNDNIDGIICAAKEIKDFIETKEKIQITNIFQDKLNSILKLGFEEISFDMFLEKALKIILSIPLLPFEYKGGILLVESEPNVLCLKTQINLFQDTIIKCAKVEFGYCICGRAAKNRKIEFASCIDSRHEILYDGITPHGHYCVPILSDVEVLGVIVFYLVEGHNRIDEIGERFMQNIASTLGVIINRHRVEKLLNEKQTQLIHVGRLTSLGEMATGVAHELNQPLAIIRSDIEGMDLTLQYKTFNIDIVPKIFKRIIKQIDRAVNIINHMRTFASTAREYTEVIMLQEPIEAALSFFNEQFRLHNIKIETRFEDNLPGARVNAQQFEQVVVNLLSNARYAVDTKELIPVATNIEFKYVKKINLHLYKDNNLLIFEIKDNGIGMSKEIMGKCLEPFYSTKDVGNGTGLGLSIVYGIVKEFGGDIKIDSSVEGGSTFKLKIPLE